VEGPSAQLMRKAGELLNAGDFSGFLQPHTDVVVHVLGSGSLSGDHRWCDGIAAVFQEGNAAAKPVATRPLVTSGEGSVVNRME
jgi:hypothetical protein